MLSHTFLKLVAVLLVSASAFAQGTGGSAGVGGKAGIGGGSVASTFDVGFDFRDTSGFVADPAGNTWQLDPAGTPNPAYPTTKTVNGYSATFGFESGSNCDSRDRDNTVDGRLAGIVFRGSGTAGTCTWRLDLPATGNYTIELAAGDISVGQTINLQVNDTNSTLFSITNVAVVGRSFLDANGTAWTDAQWPASNTKRTVTFTTTILRVVLLQPSSASSVIAHIRVYQ